MFASLGGEDADGNFGFAWRGPGSVSSARGESMKVAVLASYNPNFAPNLHYLAVALAQEGADVRFASRKAPETLGTRHGKVSYAIIPDIGRWGVRLSNVERHYRVWQMLADFRPDWVVGEHELAVSALAYKLSQPLRRVKYAAYFCDYFESRHMTLIGRTAGRMDAYVDVCDLRYAWRRRDWPRMNAPGFILRHAPPRHLLAPPLAPHAGPARVVYTGSHLVLHWMDRARLSRFLSRLCARGVAVDWYLPGTPEEREMARSLAAHPLYRVLEPLGKDALLERLPAYDVGLHWAPLAERVNATPFWDAYFLSAASNKMGEYLATGLAVAHAGNPGFAYLPPEVCAVFDPTDPEQAADRLADALSDRDALERKRAAALEYHRGEMNLEAQAAPLIGHIMSGSAPA